MKDLHSHLLFGIDDGCKNMKESIELLKKMEAAGTKEVILTPHYIENSKYVCNNEEKAKLFTTLLEKVRKAKINVDIYLGNEVFCTENFLELLKKDEIYTLNGSKYLLFELPLNNVYHNFGEIASKLIAKGYTPILAHPERYRIFQENPDLAQEYLKMGVFLQGNYPSLFGKYGGKAKKVLKYYIKKGWISFLGSDTHHDFKYSSKKLEKKLRRINKDEDYIYNILEGNFDRVIENKDIGLIR